MGISGRQLCELLDIDYDRFDGRRRRARAVVGSDVAPNADHAGAIIVPVKSLRGWNTYDLEDAACFGIALAAERLGLDPETAARLVTAADAKRVLAHEPAKGDFFVGVVRFGERATHAGATWAEW